MSISWLDVDSLSVDLQSFELSFSLEGIVLSDSSLESLSALTLAYVLDSHVNSLGNDLSSNLFVDDNTNGMLIHIEDSASLSMVEFVWHTFVDATISNNINEVTLLVDFQDF